MVTPWSGGLINTTFKVTVDGRVIAALQALHPIFGADVNLDLEAVTEHLAARGLETPRLLRTLDGAAWFEHDQRVWRATTWIDGESTATIPEPSWARAGGELVGHFHRAVSDLTYRYRFVRAGVHDTQRHLARLAECVARGVLETPLTTASEVESARRESGRVDVDADTALDLAREILAAAEHLPELGVQAPRNVHGDLKISNVVFRPDPVRAVALVDLDTLGLGTLAFELGDAMRSWCNPHGEDAGHVAFELPIFAAAIAGFRSIADPLTSADERRSIAIGTEVVCVELAARFAVDVFEDRYFGWDSRRFPSRREHNLIRARGQLALARDVQRQRGDLLDIVLAG
jgi:Ser/Thr protein kinase RdoA (MazF antagonist)